MVENRNSDPLVGWTIACDVCAEQPLSDVARAVKREISRLLEARLGEARA